MGNLTTPPSVQKLQSALHAKAKEEPGYRFYLLYDKVYRADVLEFAYRCCKANKGAAGVDGQRFEDIEAYGEGRWLGELADRLRTKTYEPNAVKRVWIPKPNFDGWTKHGRRARVVASDGHEGRRLRQAHRRDREQLHAIRPWARPPA